MKKLFKYLFVFLSFFPLISSARGISDCLTSIESMEQYLGNLKPDIFEGDSKILLRSGVLTVVGRVESFALTKTFRHKFDKLVLINNAADINELTSVSLPYSSAVRLSDVEGRVYNRENGKLVMTEIRKSDLLKEKLEGNTKMMKFNFPNVKKGSLVYYTFTYAYTAYGAGDLGLTYSPVIWNFQDDYYTLDSYFDATISNGLNYDQYNRNVSFSNCATMEELMDSKSGIWIEDSKRNKRIVYHRHDIGAYKTEPAVLGPEQYVENITLRFSTGRVAAPPNWDSANTGYFYGSRNLGKMVYEPDDTLTFLVDKIRKTHPNDLDFIKATYKYVRDSIKCTGYSEARRIWASRKPKEVWSTQKGTVSDKNILLCALFRKANLNSKPVVLSTDRDVRLSADFIDLDLLNYTLCSVEYEGKSFFLDASYRCIPFGVLPYKCYNGFALLIDEKSKPIVFNADNLTDKNTTMATLSPTEKKGTFNLKLEHRLGNVSALRVRALWESDSVKTKELLTGLTTDLKYKTKTLDWSVANIQNPDTQLSLTYNLELEMDESTDRIYLNPFIDRIVEENPFKDLNRKYPIEFPSALNAQFILKFSLPDGYMLEDAATDSKFDFKNGAISYASSMLYDSNLKTFSLNSTLLLKTTKVQVEDYKELRNFYESVVSDQNKTIVLKKIK